MESDLGEVKLPVVGCGGSTGGDRDGGGYIRKEKRAMRTFVYIGWYGKTPHEVDSRRNNFTYCGRRVLKAECWDAEERPLSLCKICQRIRRKS